MAHIQPGHLHKEPITVIGDGLRNDCVMYFKTIFKPENNELHCRLVRPTPFHEALVDGDVKFVEEVLGQLTEAERTFACNAQIDSSQETSDQPGLIWDRPEITGLKLESDLGEFLDRHQYFRDSTHTYTLPIALACLSGQPNLLQVLMTNGLDALATDSRGENAIHSLVRISKKKPDFAIYMYWQLLKLIQEDLWYDITRKKNNYGLTPLDLAAKLHLPEMLLEIFNTEGAYRLTVKKLDQKHCLYDVSDYFRSKNTSLNIFSHLSNISDRELSRFTSSRFYEREPIVSWTYQIFKFNFVLLLIPSFLMWISVSGIFLQSLFNFLSNERSYQLTYILGLVLGLSVVALLIIPVIQCLVYSPGWRVMFHDYLRNGRPIKTLCFHVLSGFILAVCLITSSFIHLMDFENEMEGLLHICYETGTSAALLAFMIFIQFVPFIGHLVLIIENMILDMVMFLVIGALFFIMASLSLFTIESSQTSKNDTFRNETGPSVSDTFLRSFLYMMSLTTPSNQEREQFGLLGMTLYIVAVLFTSLVLMNLLIGVVGQRVTELSEHRKVINMQTKITWMTFWNLERWPIYRNLLGWFFEISRDKTLVCIHTQEDAWDNN